MVLPYGFSASKNIADGLLGCLSTSAFAHRRVFIYIDVMVCFDYVNVVGSANGRACDIYFVLFM